MDAPTHLISENTPKNGAAKKPRRILLVGWDAADWRVINPLVDGGEMPTLARLIEGGVMGTLGTLHPKISPMLWNSIATGKTADKHGIHGFVERDPATGVRPYSSVSRRTKALWNIFQQALGWRCNVIGWWASHPAEPLRGTVVTNYFMRTRRVDSTWEVPPGAIHPPEREAEFGPLRMDLREVTDELILPFIPRASEIDQTKDRSLEVFAKLLSDCCTIQAAATAAMEDDAWDFTAVYFDSVDHFCHSFMRFLPPRQPHIPEREFEIFKDVVPGIYRLQDMMLERLVQLAGPDTLVVVCSDHGFQSDALRPLSDPHEPAGPVLWHRDLGILVMNGPGVRRDERVYGANLLDIAPTLLTLTGLPIGEDMDGKPLLDALEDATLPPKIPSWDAVAGDDGRHPPGFTWQASPEAAQEMIQQFVALGYVDAPDTDNEEKAQGVEVENRYNLAQVHLSSGQTYEAIKIMEDLLRLRPWESRYIHQLANSYAKGGYVGAAAELLERAYPAGTPAAEIPVVVWTIWARANLTLGLNDEAEACMQNVMDRMLRHPLLWVEAGWLWIDLKHLVRAEVCFRRAADLDRECPQAWQGLAAVNVRRKRNLEAIDNALEATQLLFHLPKAHFYLGVALAREGRKEQAITALKRAVKMQPGMVMAQRWLAALHAIPDQDEQSFLADTYRNLSERSFRERAAQRTSSLGRAKEKRLIPELPTPAERRARQEQARPPRKQAQADSGDSGKSFVVVSGLPRSGTSLMMQMLAAGGLLPKTDHERTADEDNPEGYLEWEAIKRIGKEPGILDETGLEKKAIKVISALLPSLPRTHNYRVIFMRRPVAEIGASQAKMIARRGTKGLEGESERVASALEAHSTKIMKFLRGNPKLFQVLEVDFPNLVADPAEGAKRVAEFLGPDLLPHPEKLAGAVRADLHRNKA